MSTANEVDISWDVLRRIARLWAGESVELEEVRPLLGGCVNTTLNLTTKDGQQAVLKICAHRLNPWFAHEAYQLELLRTLGLPVPQVYGWSVGSLDDPYSYLLMQHMEGIDLAQAKRSCTPDEFHHLQSHLAELVVTLHDQTADGYGRVRSDSPRVNHWLEFFHEIYDPMLHDVEKSGLLSSKCKKHLHRIHERLDRALPPTDCPRLIHGDLWATNLLAKPDENGRWQISAILDPNCKFAHAEMELAYLDLFHTVTPAFFKEYQRRHRLPGEYHSLRKPVYQLYWLVNHVQLFGQEYVKSLTDAVDRVSALI